MKLRGYWKMKKYTKPEIRFLKTSIAERIAANCWGESNAINKISVSYNNGEPVTITEASETAWEPCGEKDFIPTSLHQQIEAMFGVNLNPNSFRGSNTQTTGQWIILDADS